MLCNVHNAVLFDPWLVEVTCNVILSLHHRMQGQSMINLEEKEKAMANRSSEWIPLIQTGDYAKGFWSRWYLKSLGGFHQAVSKSTHNV